MKRVGRARCDRFQSQIVAYREGWLNSVSAGQLREHLNSCPDCQRALAEDEDLSKALAGLVPPITYIPKRRVDSYVSSQSRSWVLVPALGAAVVTAVLMWRAVLPQEVPPPDPAQLKASNESTFANAYHEMGMVDGGTDPNRWVILSHLEQKVNTE